MIKPLIFSFLLVFTGCSTLTQEVVDCPKITSPKSAAEIFVNSENNIPVYIGVRGIQAFCTKASDHIEMDVSVNIRAIRKEISKDDYAPLIISIVSVDEKNKEYDRDELSYSQFLLSGSKTIDRVTKLSLDIPNNGQVYFGIK
ncbi:hypothetical protein OAI86_02835 [Alphaproteobacteria bacterium]|nr:hypothetical protein [Alphaproteobacteria bacterium]